MGLNISRSVEIQVSNNTKNITLRNPRTFFFSSHSLWTSEPSVPPGSSSTCEFTNNSRHWGCNGLLAFEAEPFTLAIYFSNPIKYNQFSPEMGLELSLDKVHKGDLKEAYDRLVRISRGSNSREELAFPSVILKESQEKVQLNTGPVKVTATMSWGPDTVIKVKMEEQGISTVAFDYDWFCPEVDLEKFLDKIRKEGPEAANRRLFIMARGGNFASIFLRELQEMGEMSTSLGRVKVSVVRA